MQIKIDRPRKDDIDEIQQLFTAVLVDTFKKNMIPESYDGEIQDHVAKNTENVKKDLASNGLKEYFLLVRSEGKIVGIMGFGSPNKEIRKNYKIDFTDIPEIKNAFILPDFQKQGIGKQLFQNIVKTLGEKGYEAFILDSGFASSQVYWKKQLGKPAVVVKNYWGDGTDYLIWHTKLKDLSIL